MAGTTSIDTLGALCRDLPWGDIGTAEAARKRQAMLTKPPGSLGRLEELAEFLAFWQGNGVPKLDRVAALVFAGSHGVTQRGVSAFPAAVTAQMVANFAAGGAAVNQLARQAGIELKVVALDVETPTRDFTQGPAMSEEEFVNAVETGRNAVPDGVELVCVGEMGIGNTTVAATLSAALFGGSGTEWVGRGTGVDDAGLARKAETVDAALGFHGEALSDPLQAARLVGGRELAAILGAVMEARLRRVPVLLDGFVSTAAAAPLSKLAEAGLAHCLAGHVSAEAQHGKLLARLGLRPLLDLDMRLGEGSGACLAVNVLRAALACHSGMATFAEAGVSEG